MKKCIGLRVITDSEPISKTKPAIGGWGEDARETWVYGNVLELELWRGVDAQFSIRIMKNGDLILTDYQGRREIALDNNIRLVTTRPWKGKI